MSLTRRAASDSWGGTIGQQLHTDARAVVAAQAAATAAQERLLALVATNGERFINEVTASIEANIAAFNSSLASPVIRVFGHFPQAAGLVLRASDRASSWLSLRGELKAEDPRPGLRVIEQRQRRQLEAPHRFIVVADELLIDFYGRELGAPAAAQAICAPWLATLEVKGHAN